LSKSISIPHKIGWHQSRLSKASLFVRTNKHNLFTNLTKKATTTMPAQLTNTVMMVRPVDFGFNAETATDNAFQRQPSASATELKRLVLDEFDEAVVKLIQAGIKVLVLEKGDGLPTMPDAVFPNNWFSTRHDGTVVLYPMAAPNRRIERLQYPAVERLLISKGFALSSVLTIGPSVSEEKFFLEGTGSLIIDHELNRVYASISPRTTLHQLNNYAAKFGYELITFDAFDAAGQPFYHTNVVLSIGDRFAVVCADAIPESQRANVIQKLGEGREVITLSFQQTQASFCANVLQLAGPVGETPRIVMSQTAFNGFSGGHKTRLEQYGQLVPLNIPNIELVGGGSARCMLAEIFLPNYN
jgi:hypothetical protein